ncbi:MAG: integrase arm-type DNA-binding domain-containing protein [Rhodospirillales bacterium]|nr:integrase arm-type DNA-binding domain-containing protein [Rhodospirillales bacterium]
MARMLNRLSSRTVTAAKKKGLHADGGGLYLQVGPKGNKAWIFRFTLHGKARAMGLGALHTISLANARLDAANCRLLLRDGVDPIAARDVERGRNRADAAKAMTFEECARAYINAHSPAWRSLKHAKQWQSTLATYVYPMFGDLPVETVDTPLVMKAIEPIWTTKTETAGRVRGRIEVVLDWAAARKLRGGENPARWKGHLDKLLPARSKVRKVKHHAALPYDQVGAFIADLRRQDGVAARGLEFQILTAARTGEILGMTWAEYDAATAVWTVPADRTKTGKPHRVPLSPVAVNVLDAMAKVRQSDFVFPGGRAARPLSSMAFLMTLRRMGRGDLTAHGFRSTFRDWAAERTGYPNEVAEMALAHAVGDKVEAAYRRGDLFEKRVRIMADWATFCSTVQDGDGTVVPIRGTGR